MFLKLIQMYLFSFLLFLPLSPPVPVKEQTRSWCGPGDELVCGVQVSSPLSLFVTRFDESPFCVVCVQVKLTCKLQQMCQLQTLVSE